MIFLDLWVGEVVWLVVCDVVGGEVVGEVVELVV